MKRFFWILFLSLAITGCAGKASRHGEQIYFVNAATAWTVLPGYLVTNFHMVNKDLASTEPRIISVDAENLKKIEVYICYKGHIQKAKIVAFDQGYDICLLKVQDQTKIPPVLALSQIKEPPHMGQRLHHVGFPSPEVFGFAPKYLEGTVCSVLRSPLGPFSNSQTFMLNRVLKEHDKYQHKNYAASYMLTTIPGVQGSSGGPVFDETGKVVGMMCGGNNGNITSSFPLQVSLVMPISYVQDFCSLSIRAGYISDISLLQFFQIVMDEKRASVPPEESVAMAIALSHGASNKAILEQLSAQLSKAHEPPAVPGSPVAIPAGLEQK